MARRWINFVEGTLASGLAAGATTLSYTKATSSATPVASSGDPLYLVIDPEAAEHPPEIVKCTGVSGSGPYTLTIVRNQESSGDQTWDLGRKVVAAVSAAAMTETVTLGDVQTVTGAKTFAGVTVTGVIDGPDDNFYIQNGTDEGLLIQGTSSSVFFKTNGLWRASFNGDGHFTPYVDNVYDLGAGFRWRTVYATDGNFSGNIAVTGTVDGVDIATRDGVLSSTTTTAGAALPKAGGAMTGAITTNSTFEGVDIAVRDAVLTATTATANAALPTTGGTVTGATTITLSGGASGKVLTIGNDASLWDIGSTGRIGVQDSVGSVNGGIQLGSGGGQIYGDATPSRRMVLYTERLQVTNYAGTENQIQADAGGAVTLYHDDTARVATSSTGATVTGDLTVTDDIFLTTNVGLVSWNTGTERWYNYASGTQFWFMASVDSGSSYESHFRMYRSPSNVLLNKADFRANVEPVDDDTFDLGSSAKQWDDVWSTNPSMSSDATHKTDVADSALGLDFINDLRPVSFKWISTKGRAGVRTHHGFLAQEVAATLGSAASDTAIWVNGEYLDEDGATQQGSQALRYHQFTAPLVKAVQELTARVVALEAA